MRIKAISISMIIISALAWSLSASPIQAAPPITTLSQAMEYAVRHNSELKAFRLEKGVREAAEVRASLPANPTIDVEWSSGVITGNPHENSLVLSVSQEFMMAGKRDKRLVRANQDLEAFLWQVADRERLLRGEVKTAWYGLQLAEQRVALAERSITLNRQVIHIAKERLAAGDIPELEFNLMNVELARSEGIRIAVVKERIRGQARLGELIGLPLSGPAVTAEFLDATTVTNSVPQLQQLARSNRPDLKVLEAEKARGDAEIELSEAERIPNITGGLLLRRDATSMEIGGLEGRDTSYSIGLKLSVPIPLFDRNQAGIQEARARRIAAVSRLDSTRAQVDREVETAYTLLRNAESVLALYRDNILTQLEENLRLTQEAYQLGELGILSVIQEQKQFIEVNNGYLTALHDRQTAVVQLESTVATEVTGGVQ